MFRETETIYTILDIKVGLQISLDRCHLNTTYEIQTVVVPIRASIAAGAWCRYAQQCNLVSFRGFLLPYRSLTSFSSVGKPALHHDPCMNHASRLWWYVTLSEEASRLKCCIARTHPQRAPTKWSISSLLGNTQSCDEVCMLLVK